MQNPDYSVLFTALYANFCRPRLDPRVRARFRLRRCALSDGVEDHLALRVIMKGRDHRAPERIANLVAAGACARRQTWVRGYFVFFLLPSIVGRVGKPPEQGQGRYQACQAARERAGYVSGSQLQWWVPQKNVSDTLNCAR